MMLVPGSPTMACTLTVTFVNELFRELEAILGGARLSTVDRGDRDRRVHHRNYGGDERREAGEVARH